MTVRYEMTLRDIKAVRARQSISTPLFRLTMSMFGLFIIAAYAYFDCLAISLDIESHRSILAPVLWLVVPVTVSVLACAVWGWADFAQIRASPGVLGAQSATVSPQGIELRGDGWAESYSWLAVSGITENRRHVWVSLGRKRYLCIPKATLTQGDISAFFATAQSHRTLAHTSLTNPSATEGSWPPAPQAAGSAGAPSLIDSEIGDAGGVTFRYSVTSHTCTARWRACSLRRLDAYRPTSMEVAGSLIAATIIFAVGIGSLAVTIESSLLAFVIVLVLSAISRACTTPAEEPADGLGQPAEVFVSKGGIRGSTAMRQSFLAWRAVSSLDTRRDVLVARSGVERAVVVCPDVSLEPDKVAQVLAIFQG